MLTFLACIAFIDIGIGFYVGTCWILPIAVGSSSPAALPQHERPDHPAENAPVDEQTACKVTAPDTRDAAGQAAPGLKNNKNRTISTAKHSWQAAASSTRTDIVTLNERIRYAITARDKQLAKELAADIRARSRLWQQQIHDLFAQLAAEHVQDASAKIDLVIPEMCLAQIETVQTNLKLLDWSEASETILAKLERELASINKLLPVSE